ncbi:MAG: hypothetical protein IH937_13480 [Acidobacteria bacterium]|nr:hypothetical protein [Acidobacteriota bacterium]
MTAVLVAFMIVFAQMGANYAICHDLMSAESDQNSMVLPSELASSRCHLMSHCGTRCQLASQERPFSVPNSTDKALLDPAKVAPVFNPVVMESFSPTPFLWSSAAKELHKFGVKVYLLNTSFRI